MEHNKQEEFTAFDFDEKIIEEHDQEEEFSLDNLENLSKAELIQMARNAFKDNHKLSFEALIPVANLIKKIKSQFDDIVDNERNVQLNKYIENGGDEKDFEFKYDAESSEFYDIYKSIKEQKSRYVKEIEEAKNKNLIIKNKILENLRKIISEPETSNSIEEVRALQKEWVTTGDVSSAQKKEIWANYNALLDIYYNNRSIFYELKSLDRKKNLEKKIELCEKMEKLCDLENVKEAIEELHAIMREFKHIGPVPKEENERVWSRFFQAKSKLYDKREHHLEAFKTKLNDNLKRKEELIVLVKPFADFYTDQHKEWQEKTKEIQSIRAQWESIGMLPKEKSKEVSSNFWELFKVFFRNKSRFYQDLDEKRKGNYVQKKALYEEAKDLLAQNQEAGDQIAETLKEIHKKWKKIGPVPSKYRKEFNQKFEKLLDGFFNALREKYDGKEKEYEENLNKKTALCKQIKEAEIKIEQLDQQIDIYIEQWKEIGFVPKKQVNKISQLFLEAMNAMLSRTLSTENEEEVADKMLEVELKLFSLQTGDKNKLMLKKQRISKQIKELELEIANYRNNQAMFDNLSSGSSLLETVGLKIKALESRLDQLKKKLKLIKAYMKQ